MERTLTKSLIQKFLAQECTEEKMQYIVEQMNTPEGQKLFDEVMAENWAYYHCLANRIRKPVTCLIHLAGFFSS
jgi:hypothetical protein